jgi:hypothetical protein
MPSPEQNLFDDQYVVRYLLGALPEEEAERLDEMSVANDDFAWRLRGIENDLVDSYVRSELAGETLHQFKSFYMASARRRAKVAFAEGLRRFQLGNAPANESSRTKVSFWSTLSSPWIALRLGLAAGLLVMFLVAGYLLVENARLRREINGVRVQQSASEQRRLQLEKELNEQRAANSEWQKNPGTAPSAAPDIGQLKTVSLLLPPPTRGLSSLKTVTVHPDTDVLVLLLTLDSADFPRYRITLKDPAINRIVWRSSELEPVSAGDSKAVSAGLPASLLKQQNYIAEVAGLQRGHASHAVGDYAFRVVLR